jgi:phage terminase large subunit-like protein
MKALERMILAQEIAHGGNPVLAWMASNVVASEDPAENIKPNKEKSRERIDGIVALIMGLDRSIRHAEVDAPGISFI